jgi:hypothetical protein
MRIKFPIQYELIPQIVEAGTSWVVLSLKNIGNEELSNLDVRLHSTDTYNLVVTSISRFVHKLIPSQEVKLDYQVSAYSSSLIYTTIDGLKNDERYHTESPLMRIRVLPEIAELVSVFAMAKPQIPAGERLRIEAMVHALTDCENLTLEFWADKPKGDFEELASIKIAEMKENDVGRYSAEITPSEEGMYKITTYLYDGIRRLDSGVDHVLATTA